MEYPFVESPNVTRASGRSIDVVVIHTMEISERADAAEICARWFQSPVSEVSAHYCVDADSVVQCVREKDVAWHARGGNTNSIGVELAGFASQTTRDWRDSYSAAVLERAAALVAGDLVAGRRGLTGHVEVSRAFGKSDHWDPGDGFPVESFVDRVRVLQQAQRRAARRRRARA